MLLSWLCGVGHCYRLAAGERHPGLLKQLPGKKGMCLHTGSPVLVQVSGFCSGHSSGPRLETGISPIWKQKGGRWVTFKATSVTHLWYNWRHNICDTTEDNWESWISEAKIFRGNLFVCSHLKKNKVGEYQAQVFLLWTQIHWFTGTRQIMLYILKTFNDHGLNPLIPRQKALIVTDFFHFILSPSVLVQL